MKFLIFPLLLWSTQSMADLPEIRASQATCEELQDFVKKHKDVTVLKRGIFKTKKVRVIYSTAECSSSYYYESNWSFKTIDDRHCEVGRYCKYSPPVDYSTYDSGSSYNGSSNYDQSSGWGWGSTSDSSSGGYGSSYNPPSSGYQGPSYNPPSGGGQTRGPRYCPTCH